MGSCAFVPPRLPAMLYGRTRHTYPVGAPEGPTGGSGGPAIVRHHPPGHSDHPVGVMSAGRGYITEINIAVLCAAVTGVRCVCHQEINRVTGAHIAHVMQ